MSKNKSKNQTKVRPYAVMCTDLYLLWILAVYPLYYADGYFHLPEKKAAFWCVSTLIYLGVTLFGVIITAFSDREQWTLENLKKNISMTDIFMFGFLVSNLIAFALSEDKVNAWTGASSRYYGAKVLILVCLVYFFVSRYAWVNKVFIWAFLIGGNGVCLLATFDYFGMDVLGINQQMQQWDWLIFISTLGNANTCSSYVTMIVAGALCYFCVVKETKEKVFVGISIVNCSMALITARSDSAFVGIAVILIILGVLAIVKKIECKDYIMTLALVDMGFLILFLLRKRFVQYLILETFDTGIQRVLNQIGLLTILLVILVLIYSILFFIEKKNIKVNVKKKVSNLILGLSGIGLIVFIIVVNNKLDVLQIFKSGMGIGENITVGSRAYTYAKVIQSYQQLPLINKFFGCGQATMTSVLNQYFGTELATAGISINSAHNNILDYLIITGLFGTICYIGTFINVIRHAVISFKESKYVIVFMGAVVAYFAQGIFNIEQTNTTTIYWLMLVCSEAIYRTSVMKKKEH